MKNFSISKLMNCAAVIAICAFSATTQATPYQLAVWDSGNYYNMFAYYGVNQDDYATRNRMQQQYNQLFKGTDSQKIMYPASGSTDMSYILDVNSNDIRSEGMSYGMMIAVQMNDQDTFDRLWRFAKTYMQNPDKSLAWQLNPTDYSKIDDASAPDGEEYMAMALYFAQGRIDRFDWADTGLNYKTEGKAILDVLRQNLFDSTYHQVLPTAEASANYRFTDPSYHLPAFYELWEHLDADNADFWSEAHYQSRMVQFAAAHPDTGLFSEYSTFNPGPTPISNVEGAMTVDLASGAGIQEPQRSNSIYFFSDAHRVIGNIGMDYAWFTSTFLNYPNPSERRDSALLERAIAERQYAFYASRDDLNGSYISGYELDGTPKPDTNYKAPGHVAMNAVGSIAAAPSPTAKSFVQALWDQDVPSDEYRYYNGMLHMLAMLHVSGRFRIYAPLSSGLLNNQTASTFNQAQMAFTLRNTDQSTQFNPTAYYYFTTENGRTPVVDDIYTPNISSLNLENLGGNQWAVRMQYAGVTLNSTQAVSQADTFRLRYSDWSAFNISNDFSAPVGDQVQSADRIAVFNSAGKLVMGAKPNNVSNPAPTPYSIRIRARGTTGQELINLTVGGTVVASWRLTTSFANYDVSTALAGGINVVYTNDGGTRDVVVDYAEIGGARQQAEQQTNNTAAYGNGRCGGGQLTEWMHCNGYLGFSAYR